jgi:hypothetical protein
LFQWLRRRRRLSADARRKLLIAAARSEEAVIETHVSNVLDLLDLLADEVDVDRGIELYLEMMPLDEHATNAITNRVLARYEDEAVAGRGGRRYEDVFRDRGR